MLNWGIYGEEGVPDKEHEFQEGPELDCPDMACALGVFTVLTSEVEPQSDQGCCGHNGVDNVMGDGLFPLDWGIFDLISFELSGEALVQANVSLGVGFFSGVR